MLLLSDPDIAGICDTYCLCSLVDMPLTRIWHVTQGADVRAEVFGAVHQPSGHIELGAFIFSFHSGSRLLQ